MTTSNIQKAAITTMTIDTLQKSRKILAVVFLTVAVVFFTVATLLLIEHGLSENFASDTWYPALWLYLLFIPPIVISLLIGAYLIYPSKFGKVSKVAKKLSVFLVISGFGIAATLVPMSIINSLYFPASYVFESILVTFPFLMMGIFALLAFKKDKFEEMKNGYKLGVVLALTAVTILSALYILFKNCICFLKYNVV